MVRLSLQCKAMGEEVSRMRETFVPFKVMFDGSLLVLPFPRSSFFPPSLKNIFVDYAITVVPFPPFTPLHSAHPLPPTFPPYSSCTWVILISSLVSTFPTLFLPSRYLFSTYHLCYFISLPFPPLSPSQSPIDNPPCDLHFCGSVSVLVVCLVCFCFGFNGGC